MAQYGFEVEGPSGIIEAHAFDPGDARRGIALVAHPHPLFGGTMENKVVHTLAKSFLELGFLSVRFNFRGVGKSQGVYDEGRGEAEDALFLLEFLLERYGELPVALAGFSFGGYVQAKVSKNFRPEKLVLVAPAVGRFEMPEVEEGALIIHGEEDDVVPLSNLLDWARPQEHPIVLFPGAGHFFHGRLHQIKKTVIAYCRD